MVTSIRVTQSDMWSPVLQSDTWSQAHGHLRPGTDVTNQICHLQYGPLKS